MTMTIPPTPSVCVPLEPGMCASHGRMLSSGITFPPSPLWRFHLLCLAPRNDYDMENVIKKLFQHSLCEVETSLLT